MQDQIDTIVHLVIAFFSVLTVIGVSAAGVLVSMVVSARRELNRLRSDVEAYRAVAQKLEGDAKHNVDQIWARLDDEMREDVKKLVAFISGLCPDAPKKG